MAKLIKIICHGCGELFTAYGKPGKSKLSIRTIVDCSLHETKKKKNQTTIEERLNQLSRCDLEMILLTLIEVDKHINVSTRVKREIIKKHEDELLGVWG